MQYDIVLAPSAVRELGNLTAPLRAQVRDAIERHLRHEPEKLSKSRIKRLRGMSHPQFRLRVQETRVFYDIREGTVEILAIVSKAEVEAWLKAHGETDPGTSGEGQG
jgi:mRNA interferase RelE/StbE